MSDWFSLWDLLRCWEFRRRRCSVTESVDITVKHILSEVGESGSPVSFSQM